MKRKYACLLATLIVTLFIFPACSGRLMERPYAKVTHDDLAGLNDKVSLVAREVAGSLRGFNSEDLTIAVSTFVDIDNLEQTSSFGRYVAEQLAGELYSLGFNIRELRQRIVVTPIPRKGEMALSRHSAELLKEFPVDAMLVGSYTRIGAKVVVNIRLVDTAVSRVVSVGRMVVAAPTGGYVGNLLMRETEEVIKVRVPVVRLSMAGERK